ncbi:MAG: chorismate mutase [Anaerolineales bacterium]
MSIRGIRGAITAAENSASAILEATRSLLTAIQRANPSLEPEDITSIFFTMTTDLNATYPALAARQMGWVQVPLLCAQEIPVPDSLPRCIRVLVHWNTDLPQSTIRHVYLGEAARLRPDLAALPLSA